MAIGVKWRRRLAGLLAVSLLALGLTAFSPPQQYAELIILVRDIRGIPLQGINVRLHHGNTTQILPDSVRTNAQGLATFTAEPGRYVVAFSADWATRQFIPVDQQNAGVNEANGGGFPITLDQKNETYLFTYVIALNSDGLLVPLIDLSRDPQSTPDPFLYEGSISSEVSINQDLIADLTIQPMATAVNPNPTEEATGDSPEQETDAGDIFFLVLALIFAGGAVIVMWSIIWMQSRRGR